MSAPADKGPFSAPPVVYVVQPPGVEYRVLPEEELADRRMPQRDAEDDRPVAYLYRPVGYELVTPERLDEWEKLMSERVGLTPPSTSDVEAQMPGTRSVSFCCEGLSCGCDCDVV